MTIINGRGIHQLAINLTRLFKMLAIGVLLIFAVLYFNHVRLEDYFPIRTVSIYGIFRIDQGEVQQSILPMLDKGFFAIDVDLIRDRLQAIPWVSASIVRRNWPDRLIITILEKVPIAKWNNEGILSENGELFNPKDEKKLATLPVFVGPAGKHLIMLDYFNKMNRLLLPLHAKISYLELTPYLTWKLKLDNGMTLKLGHKDILTRLSHFVKVAPKVMGDHAKDVDYIDLRYTNGFAVRHKS